MDGIERDLEGKAEVLRLGVMNGVGRQLASRYGVRRLPTVVLLDGDGDVVLSQAGSPQRGAILAAVELLTE